MKLQKILKNLPLVFIFLNTSGQISAENCINITADNVHLKGGAITSTNPANSELTTNKLTFEDIQNSSSYSATSGAISGGYSQSGSTSVNPSIPMHEQGNDNSITKATLTEGKITLNKDSQPTETTAAALGINTDINQANKQVKQPKDVNQLLKEQKIIRENVGHIATAASNFSNRQAKEAESEKKKAGEALEKAKASGDVAKIDEKQTAYNEASIKAEAWGEGGSNRRKVDATVAVVGAILAGKTTAQTAVAAVSPELNAQIHELTKDSKTANLFAHAALSAAEFYAAGLDPASGALAGVVGEGSAMLLAEKVFNKQPNELTAEEKGLLKVASQLAGAIAGGVAGNSTATAVEGMATAKRAVENNYLYANEAKEKSDLERKIRQGVATEKDKNRLAQINLIDQVRDKDIMDACQFVSASACQELVTKADYARYSYEQSISYNTKLKELYPADYQNVLEILKGKDKESVEFEKIALNISKSQNISFNEAKDYLSKIKVYQNVAELVGAIRGGTAAKYGINPSKVTTPPTNYPKVIFNGYELHPDLPPPKAGYDFVPQKAKGNTLYQEWKDINGYRGEIQLANQVASTGRTVVKWGDKTGSNGSDIISVNPKTGDVELWDSKYRSGSTKGKESPTFDRNETRMKAIEEAIKEIDSTPYLPAKIKNKAIENLNKGNFKTYTTGSGKVKNSIIQEYCNYQKCISKE